MQNLNDPKLTNQERQQILKLAIDADYRQKVEDAKKEGYEYTFNSYWVIQPEDLIKLNTASQKNDTLFDFYNEKLEEIAPFCSILLFEGNRVEEGEWDKLMGRWAPYSYQQVTVLNCNSRFVDFAYPANSKSVVKQGIFAYDEPDEDIERMSSFIRQHPATFEPDGGPKQPCALGILDIPLEMLDKYEECRVKEAGWWTSDYYSSTINERINWRKEEEEKAAKRREYKNSKRTKRQLHKTFKGGFAK
jgi:hypothetical protein